MPRRPSGWGLGARGCCPELSDCAKAALPATAKTPLKARLQRDFHIDVSSNHISTDGVSIRNVADRQWNGAATLNFPQRSKEALRRQAIQSLKTPVRLT